MINALRLPLFIAKRYLFSRKQVGAINIVSGISVIGVAFGTAALLCTLSVFRGFHDLLGSFYTTFDPPVKVVPTQGKLTPANDTILLKIKNHPQVAAASACLEDHALILLKGRPLVITLKGVDNAYNQVTNIQSILYGEGAYKLHHAGIEYGIPGIGLASAIGSIEFGKLQICAPRKGERVNLTNPLESLSADYLNSSGVCFDVKQRKYDENYLITSLNFAQNLFEQENRISAIEIKLKPGADAKQVQNEMQAIAGNRFKVLNQLEQQPEIFNWMEIEKMMAYLFLTFILLISCFNIVGSVSMLIINKREDVETFRHMGASNKLIFRIFLYEGRFIALLGTVIGMTLGLFLCWLQQNFGLVTLGNGSEFVVRAYPVSVQFSDVVLVFCTVITVGFVCVWYPIKYLSRRYLNN